MFSLLACRKLVSTSQADVSGNLGAKCLQHWSLSACQIELSRKELQSRSASTMPQRDALSVDSGPLTF